MNLFITCSDTKQVNALRQFCEEKNRLIHIVSCKTGIETLKIMKGQPVDAVMIEWELSDISGPALGNLVREEHDNVQVIYISKNIENAPLAFDEYAFGFILIPLERERVFKTLSRLEMISENRKRESRMADNRQIEARTFGYFDIYMEGQLIIFKNRRAKEILAMLIAARGGSLTNERIMENFWPDQIHTDKHKAIYRKALNALVNTLAEKGMGDIVINSRGSKAVRAELISCDFYRMMDGDIDAIKSYRGMFLTEYSWAEETNGYLSSYANKANRA